MGHYPFTLFNAVTALLLMLTAALVWERLRGAAASNWTLVFYALALAYTFGFKGGLNPYWVLAGALLAVTVRFGLYVTLLRNLQLVPLGYIACRLLGLLLMW